MWCTERKKSRYYHDICRPEERVRPPNDKVTGKAHIAWENMVKLPRSIPCRVMHRPILLYSIGQSTQGRSLIEASLLTIVGRTSS